MHRSYSMRQSRAPTASQMQSPAPPAASTKSHGLFRHGSITHAFRRNTAGVFAPELSKKLAQLVKMEKNVMRSIEQVSRERRDVARQLSLWGEHCDPDISDVTDKLGVLIHEIGVLEDQHIDQYDRYRVTLKSIRDIESSVQPCRDRKARITAQIAQLRFKDPASPKLVVLEQELVRSEAETLVAEAQLTNTTREKLKMAFGYQFDALREHAEKVAIIAGYGQHLLNLVDDSPVTPGQPRAPYHGYETSRAIVQDCEDALTGWVAQNAAIRPALSQRSRNLSRIHGRSKGSARGRDSAIGSWVPASEHLRVRGSITEDEDGEESDEIADTDVDEPRRLGPAPAREQPSPAPYFSHPSKTNRLTKTPVQDVTPAPTPVLAPAQLKPPAGNEENIAPLPEYADHHGEAPAPAQKQPIKTRTSAKTPLREVPA